MGADYRENYWLNLLIVPIVLLAALLRLNGNDWDAYEHFHPDERYISWVASSIEWPESWEGAFDPQHSTFNLYYWPAADTTDWVVIPMDEQRDFAYGHFPVYIVVVLTRLAERIEPFGETGFLNTHILNGDELVEFDHVTVIGRATSAIVDVLTVLMLFRLGKLIFDTKTGLLAAFLLAVTVLHIQSAHFFISDPFLALFVVAAIFNMVKAISPLNPPRWGGSADSPPSGRGWGRVILAAIFTGLAVGSKFSAIMLGLPLLVTVLVVNNVRYERTWCVVIASISALLLAAGTFVLTNPFAVLDWTCEAITPAFWIVPELDWRSCYLFNVGKQSSMVSGASDVSFARQYTGTLPFVYFGEMLGRWGMGWSLMAISLVGWVWSLGFALRHSNQKMSHLIIYLWMFPFAIATGRFFVKFLRYLLPLTPFLVLYGSAMLLRLPWAWLRRVLVTVVIATTAVYALAFNTIYSEPHPWMAASEWIYDNVSDGSGIAWEVWGDRLPVRYTVDGERLSPEVRDYVIDGKVNWLSRPDSLDNEKKLLTNFEVMAAADYYIIDSNRSYGVVSRLPERYPLSSGVYARLFDGSLGYELRFVANRAPRLGHVYLQPDFFTWATLAVPEGVQVYFDERGVMINGGRTDESFMLYDQSLTMIFENVGALSAEQMLDLVVGH